MILTNVTALSLTVCAKILFSVDTVFFIFEHKSNRSFDYKDYMLRVDSIEKRLYFYFTLVYTFVSFEFFIF